ncbi:MAG TPA: (Fe-S)-binding protein [Lysobacter sp.]|nr:(Fe-S)-binding protein [Lysobacter sp.]
MSPAPVPSPASAIAALADRCVQCGLCLPACPTYAQERIEAESPRGRIALMRAWALEVAIPTPAGDRHLDQCLGCRRCEVVCPAGVRYAELLVAARGTQRSRRRPGRRQRAIEVLTRHPRLLRALLQAYRRLHPLLPAAARPLPAPPRALRRPPLAAAEAVAVFVGCVASEYEAGTRGALARLCAAAGARCVEPAGQTCCGALHAHAGDLGTAAALAARNRRAFAGYATVLTLASGCHDAVAAACGASARDALTFLAERAGRLSFRSAPMRVALHLPCTQQHLPGAVQALRMLLARVPALEVVELDGGYGCCGAAGSQMLTDPARAAAFRAPLLAAIAGTGAQRVLSANLGCRLHLAGEAALPVQHPLDFLAEHLDDGAGGGAA